MQPNDVPFEDVDAQVKPGQGDFLWFFADVPTRLTLLSILNRTEVGLSRG